jgi:hypothetical protein
MRYRNAFTSFAFAMLFSTMAWSDTIKVSETKQVNASAERVWMLIGGFNDLNKWHPVIAQSEYDPGKKVRTLTTKDGGKFVEELLTEKDKSYSYRILSSPLPVTNYSSTLAVRPLDQNSSEVSWSSEFQPTGVSQAEAQQIVRQIYIAGLDNIANLIK